MIGFILVAAFASFSSYVILGRGFGVKGYLLERWTIVAAFSLLVGCLAAVLMHFRPASAFMRFCRSNAALPVAAVLFALPALVLLVPGMEGRVLPNYGASSVQALGIGVFVLWIAARQDSVPVSLLEFAPLRYVGTISYGIYIWQGFFLAVSPYRDPQSSWPPPPLLGQLGIAIFAPISYHYFEKPFLAMKERFKSARTLEIDPSVALH